LAKLKNKTGKIRIMQTVFPGERRLKRRILRRIYKEMILNWLKKILGKKPDDNSEKEPDDEG
jgi:hypothetical protein